MSRVEILLNFVENLRTPMAQNEKLNQKRLETLQMSLIDLSRTEWMERYQDDILILHNPHFKANWAPYKLKQLVVILCNEGHGAGAVNLRPVHLQKNTLLIALPSQIAESKEIGEDFKGTFVVMSERFLSRMNIGDAFLLLKSVENHPVCQLDEQTAAVFRSLIDLSHKLMQVQQPGNGLEEAHSLLIRLFLLLVSRIIGPSSGPEETQVRQHEVMLRFFQLVKQYFREHRDVGFYADQLNMSAKYMTTLIKKASGKSAMQWIEESVILDAKAQLSSTVNTVQQIAFDLNFPSQSLFGRYFKRMVGMSPSDYRASVRAYQMAAPL